ncbi:MAG: beta-propeller domain-containing protein [Patescibacteria group bacterium]|jgi:inhibitor of cysteine peptidase
MSKKIFYLSFLALLFSLTLSGCSFPWEKKREPMTMENNNEAENFGEVKISSSSGDLRKFSSDEALKTFLASASTGGGFSASWLLAETGYGLIDQSNLDATTNNQEQAFNSADIIKYENGYIYALVKNELFIISASPASDAKIMSKISFSSRPLELVVADGRLAVLGNDSDLKDSDAYRSFNRKNDFTFLKIFDVFDPADPKEIRAFYFEGGYSGLKLAGNYIYLLTASPAFYSERDPLTPRIIENNKIISGGCGSDKDCVKPTVYYFDHVYSNYNYLSLSAISLADRNEPISNNLFLVDSNYSFNISSTGNLYLSRFSSLSAYDLEQEIRRDKILPKLNKTDQGIIKEIEASPDYMLSAGEKTTKVGVLLSRYVNSLTDSEKEALQTEIKGALLNKIKQRIDDLETTDVYKFSLKSGKIEYQARGQVLGQILNRLAMTEQNGNLYLVTVRNNFWSMLFEESDKRYSNVYILDDALKSVGVLENIATEKELLRARFLGNRVYLSTSEADVPVYVVSLENKSEPKIVGAIKIANFDTLYSFDKTGGKILGFGREVNGTTENSQGLKLSLFDFSDLQKPKELSGYLIGDSSSESAALKDYRSFVYSPEKKIIILPTVFQTDNLLNFTGVLVLDTDGESFELKGRIDHLYGSNYSLVDYWRGFNYYENAVKRSFIEGDNLFTFSNKYIRINNLSDLTDIQTISLTPEAERIFIPKPVSGTEGEGVSNEEINNEETSNADEATESTSESASNSETSSASEQATSTLETSISETSSASEQATSSDE